jgi:hypothetical protein
MRRSFIDARIDAAHAAFEASGLRLPPWAGWTPARWAAMGEAAREVREAGLGWDLTDFGSGDFEHCGLLLFTVRNGCAFTGKPYAEKIMLAGEGQVTPMHLHWSKMEDIINRGGATLAMRLFMADPQDDRRLSDAPFKVSVDGIRRTLKAGDIVRLSPGESITYAPRLYHTFWAEGGEVVIGEVSMVNDDANDNGFYEPRGRFPAIEEDAVARHSLCTEYP